MGRLVDDDAVLLAWRLNQARQEAGLTQQQVSDQTGIPRTALSDVERGRRGVGALELRDLARLYGVSVSDLLEEDTEPLTPAAARLAPIWSGLSPAERQMLLSYATFLESQH